MQNIQKTSKHTLRITPENIKVINQIANDIAKTVKNFIRQKDAENKHEFSLMKMSPNQTVFTHEFTAQIINPYTNQLEDINITIELGNFLRTDIEAQLINKNIKLAIPLGVSYSRNHEALALVIKGSLIHEIAHVIDPKYAELSSTEGHYSQIERGTPEFWKAYVSDKREIDAYQSEMVEVVNDNIEADKISLDAVLEFLRSSANHTIQAIRQNLGLSGILCKIIVEWQNEYPNVFKLFKQRLYAKLMED